MSLVEQELLTLFILGLVLILFGSNFISSHFHFLVVMSAKLSRKSDFQFLVVMSAKLSRKSDFQFIFKLTHICFSEVLSFIYAICIYYYIYWCPT
jgi:hypothetical protein